VQIEESHFIEVDVQGKVLREGVTPPLVEPIAPKNGAKIATRGQVTFEWTTVDGAKAYVVEVFGGREKSVRRRVAAPRSKVSIDLESGQYLWAVRAEVDGNVGVAHEHWMVDVDVDQTPPRLEVSEPSAGASARGASIRVAGMSEPGARVRINGREVTVERDGAFSAEINVGRGISNIVVQATDELGNARAVTRTVLRE